MCDSKVMIRECHFLWVRGHSLQTLLASLSSARKKLALVSIITESSGYVLSSSTFPVKSAKKMAVVDYLSLVPIDRTLLQP